ncbi:MAG TPA: ArsB/NhaD family transporter [bacterium]|nr:ArsB/NhaD family transporter [bacterium]
MLTVWGSVILLATVFVVVAMGKIEAAVISLLAAVVVLATGVLGQAEAFAAIDWNTIFLLVGMMMVVAVAKKTGLFQYLAIRSAKAARGNPLLILLFFPAITALISAFLDNVTTVLLIAPVTILIADSLELDPVPFLIAEAIASNIGGTATLIGDPPNIMIGSAAGLGFNAFILNLTPVILVIQLAFSLLLYLLFRRRFHVNPELKAGIMEMDENRAITDPHLTRVSLTILGLILIGFVCHQQLGLEPATIALAGATLLLFLSQVPSLEIFQEVEWTTIFFFIGLFIVVAAVDKQGVFAFLGHSILGLTEGHLLLTALLVLWISAFAAAFVGAVPFVASMIPLLKAVTAQMPSHAIILWWALSLGACLGGNGTLTGAAANMVVADIARKNDRPISYLHFFRWGFPVMLLSLLISSLYIFLRCLYCPR